MPRLVAPRTSWLKLLAGFALAACGVPTESLQVTAITMGADGQYTAVWECGEGCDDGAPLELVVRAPGGAPERVAAREIEAVRAPADRLTVMIVVDASGDAGPLVRAARRALTPAFGTLADAGAQAGLVRASTRASLLAAPSRDADALVDAAAGLYTRDGWHALYDGIRMANEAMGGTSDGVVAPLATTTSAVDACGEVASHAIVAIVGGADTNSADQNRPGDDVATRLGDLERLVVGAGRPALHVIMVDATGDGLEDLAALARASGGSAVAVDGPDDVEAALDARVDALLHRTRRCATFAATPCPRFELTAHVEGEQAPALAVACGVR